MKKYIDCDGVILDTETGLFDRYHQLKETNPTLRKSIYLHDLDWDYWIHQANVINDAINLLRESNPRETSILTKVHSMNEAAAKIRYFREKNIQNDIIIVPSSLTKSQVVSAAENILVEDSLSNLDDWFISGGIPIYFGLKETDYPVVTSLEQVLSTRCEEIPKIKQYIKK